MMNNVQLVLQFAQQVQAYQTQLQQYDTMLRNLQTNPGGVSLQGLNQMASNLAQLNSYGRNLGSGLQQLNDNFAKTFDNPVAKDFSGKFKAWTDTSQDGLKSAMRNAGMQRDQFPDDTTALQGLMQNLSAAQGNLSALQALGALNARQVQESMKLRDLISQQQVAQNNYMMSESKKTQEREKIDAFLQKGANERVQRPWETGKPLVW
ncbi:hypothetical protein GH865_10890 [Rhodocyclus tenuis]|uniref:hypothetical protein n=1 Tax=Rhodocyclus gracilis TaxID=2929842 RepID=UPI001298BF93|nr:hypothetical protein [Rhodocyclus gracilis]MRD73751.1 hypothetical protein [Rhodocyclus gracilis]